MGSIDAGVEPAVHTSSTYEQGSACLALCGPRAAQLRTNPTHRLHAHALHDTSVMEQAQRCIQSGKQLSQGCLSTPPHGKGHPLTHAASTAPSAQVPLKTDNPRLHGLHKPPPENVLWATSGSANTTH